MIDCHGEMLLGGRTLIMKSTFGPASRRLTRDLADFIITPPLTLWCFRINQSRLREELVDKDPFFNFISSELFALTVSAVACRSAVECCEGTQISVLVIDVDIKDEYEQDYTIYCSISYINYVTALVYFHRSSSINAA